MPDSGEKMGISNVFLFDALKTHINQIEAQKKELELLPRGKLAFRQEKGRTEFVHLLKNQNTGETIRHGITKNDFQIHQLARKKYLEASIEMLEKEISRLKEFLDNRMEPTPKNILRSLPEKYQRLPEKYFFSQNPVCDSWEADDYQINTFKPEEKIHITSRGLHVRSRAEAAICEKLYEFGLPFRYEQMIFIENHSFSPDFTIKSKNGFIYWEHCGMMNIPRYRKNNKWKLSMYEKAGIVPWKNLIVTYETDEGGLNMAVIEGEIRNKILFT